MHHCNEGGPYWVATGSELVVEGSGKGNGAGWQSEPPCTARRALTSDHRQSALRPRIRPESRLIGATPTRAATWMAGDSPEFGQFSEKSPCGHVADARNGFQERLASRQAGECLMASPMSWSIASSSFWR